MNKLSHGCTLDCFDCCKFNVYVEEEKMKSILLDTDMDPSLSARKLMKSALDAGGYDNVTVIFIDMDGEA